MQKLRKVVKQKKVINYLSSDIYTCQVIVKPDCSKPTIQKSVSIKTASLGVSSKQQVQEEQNI